MLEKWAKGEMNLYERANDMLEQLASFGIGDKPIVFITHSLGGLLAKVMLRASNECSDASWKRIVENTRLVAFLSTPHIGAELGKVVQFFIPHLVSTHVRILSKVRDHQNPLADTPALVPCQAPQLRHPRFATKKVCWHRLSPKHGTLAESLYHIWEFPEAGIMNLGLFNKRYLAAGQYTIADMICYPWASSWATRKIDIDEFSNVKRWLEEIGERPAVKKAMTMGPEFREDPASISADERAPPDLHIAGAALRTECPEPGWLVAALRGWTYGEAAERTHQVKRSLSLPGTGNWPSGMRRSAVALLSQIKTPHNNPTCPGLSKYPTQHKSTLRELAAPAGLQRLSTAGLLEWQAEQDKSS